VLRTDGGYWAYIGEVRSVLTLLPVFGLVLAGLVGWIAVDSLRPSAGSRVIGRSRP